MNTALPQAPALLAKKKKLAPLNQWVVIAVDMAAAEKQRRYLAPKGGKIVSRRHLSGLKLIVSTFRFQPEVNATEVMSAFKDVFPSSDPEPNQRYRLLNQSHENQPLAFSKNQTYGQRLTGIGAPSRCQQPLSLAMLDSAVSRSLSFLPASRVSTLDVTRQTRLSSQHGTAVATLLVANNDSFPSLLPNAHLTAINVFALDDNDEPETRSDWLLYGLNALSEMTPPPDAVNLSFGGNYSGLLEKQFNKLSQTMMLVAAAGNDGTDELLYPAGYHAVYAVGGVDARGKKSRRSNYGSHVVVMAPGEDIWTSDDNGQGRYMSGTSYAAPFATAAIALASKGGVKAERLIDTIGPTGVVEVGSLCR